MYLTLILWLWLTTSSNASSFFHSLPDFTLDWVKGWLSLITEERRTVKSWHWQIRINLINFSLIDSLKNEDWEREGGGAFLWCECDSFLEVKGHQCYLCESTVWSFRSLTHLSRSPISSGQLKCSVRLNHVLHMWQSCLNKEQQQQQQQKNNVSSSSSSSCC